MHILIISATSFEIAPLIAHLENESPEHEIDILITGIGMTATTYSLTRQLQLHRPDLVIQAGVGGSFEKKHRPGKVVAVKSDRIADEGVLIGNRLVTVNELALREADKHPYQKGWLQNPHENILQATSLEAVPAISVNLVSSQKKMIRIYRKKFAPVVESMEGASLHLVCLSENIPFVQLRAISNEVGERDKKKWKLKKAIRALNRQLIALLMNPVIPQLNHREA
jgi:futalosine hydrolase